MVFNNVLFQTSTSVKQTLTVAVLMPFVTTPTDPSIAHVNLDIKEMEKTAHSVIFFLVSGLLAWHQKLCVCFLVCFIFFYFLNNLLPLYLNKKGKYISTVV